MIPLLMPPNILDHFYLGGERIAELRGTDMPSPRRPEEWLAATTRRAGEGDTGLSRTPDGALLRDLIAADPIAWLGSDAGPSGDNGILVKLLDPGQRLPVHVHPERPFSVAHLDCPYGKTEAWYVLATSGEQPSVWLGWTEDVDPAELAERIDAQDSEWMLSRMHRLDVKPGDGILVPAGTTHAIGSGVFVAEVQEPTDFSILLEWIVTTATREESHLDLGFPLALQALNHHGWSADEVADLVLHTDPARRSDLPIRLLPPQADPFFLLHRVAPAAAAVPVDAGFAVVVVLDGSGTVSGTGGSLDVTRGQVLAVPHDFGDWTASGALDLVVCRPGAGWPATLHHGTAVAQ
ncbi:phosphoheptose isomerase [Nakamurella sp. YIM 132087]|uniref:Phosphoheptose isomerase n=1 Tax=Nakamurella alba TaxID=2665158 RepID=A0A7K1FNB1_9ACTN|nr:class I mannose-6-phosphate isomerase [Nakamurella alba]MTD15618.1 phosphoheptose isomerase [Nakamurella alba]